MLPESIENTCIIDLIFIYFVAKWAFKAHFFYCLEDNILADIEDIRNLVIPVLDEMGIDLVDLQLFGSGSRTILRVFVDETGGITLQRCTKASRKISDVLDMNEPLPGKYILEVSSPGTEDRKSVV